ncbi:MAG: ATP-binding cassette domain-containing protein, partial [Edwardsiella piscicida]
LRRNVGMVFQQYNLWPHLTVMQNLIEAPCRVLGLSKEAARARAGKLLQRLRLSEFVARYPLHLSGGQQQRVAIARALMMEPQVLLFDEPTAALDPEITAQIVSIIHELAETGITQVIVTHEVEVARKTASRVVYMEQGRIIEQGDASHFSDPQTSAFAGYLSH